MAGRAELPSGDELGEDLCERGLDGTATGPGGI